MPSSSISSTMIRSGRVTFFIDVKEAKTGAKYISISEHRIDAECVNALHVKSAGICVTKLVDITFKTEFA